MNANRQILLLSVLLLSTTACGLGLGGSSGSSGGAAAAAAASGGGGGGGGLGSLLGGGDDDGGSSGEDPTSAFSQTVYPILRDNCMNCHAGAGPGFPHIASSDLNASYSAVVDNQKVDFVTPFNSRLVQRLTNDLHHCWTQCADDGETLRAAIEDWAGRIAGSSSASSSDPNSGGSGGTPGPGNTVEGMIMSQSVSLTGASQGQTTGRIETDVIALYEFKTGSGNMAFDTSGVAPAMDLMLEGVDWVGDQGIEITTGSARASEESSRKLFDEIASEVSGTQEYSIEAWVIPANVTQEGPARIVSYSLDTQRRNFTMGQTLYNYVFRNRSGAGGIGRNGTPELTTNDDDEDLQAALQHVVMTFDQTNGRRIYVNGMDTGDRDENGPGLLTNWNPEYPFLLGNEKTNDRLWQGQFQLVAIHKRALTPAQISQNYAAGVTQKFALRFDLDTWLPMGTYIEFEVSEFDGFSYLFCFPTFVSPVATSTAVEGLRIAVNDIPPVASQSFRNVSTVVTETEEQLSDLCSVVPKSRGPALDQFSILFDVLGDNVSVSTNTPPVVVQNDDVAAPSPDSGIRSFDQINDTMARLTGLDPLRSNIERTFEDLTQQLPSTTDARTFVSAHQVAISKLALEYCDTLVDSRSAREDFFGTGFDFDAPVVNAFANQADKDMIIDALIDQMLGVNLASQPAAAEVQPLLNGLIDSLTAGCNINSCASDRTRTVVKGTCAAVLASAPVHIQ